MEDESPCTVARMKQFVKSALEGAAEGLKDALSVRDEKIDGNINKLLRRSESIEPLEVSVRTLRSAIQQIDARVSRLEEEYAVDHRRLVEAHAIARSLARNAQHKPKAGPAWTAPNLD
ncbi:hypothetical protein IAE60_10325 [Pseudoxanthomonas mexicana]|uniref:Uncharacterized protein n=1 Tax=Pseudoxanthomonas mexicana TaxID=128785 RepID=A0A7G9T8D5_PSEMX|nr:hypothetical protein [Pseudoxanthomonas mexicana]QNN76360.1 hypothetical protein IAE60_10325 [Pseudoxanthomonas mexicana]